MSDGSPRPLSVGLFGTFEGGDLRGLHARDQEHLVRERWKTLVVEGDPYYNPNLTRASEDFGLDV